MLDDGIEPSTLGLESHALPTELIKLFFYYLIKIVTLIAVS